MERDGLGSKVLARSCAALWRNAAIAGLSLLAALVVTPAHAASTDTLEPLLRALSIRPWPPAFSAPARSLRDCACAASRESCPS